MTGETNIITVYGSEKMVPVEIAAASHQVKYFDTILNNVEWQLELYLVDERRLASEEIQGKMCITIAHYYNRRVLARQFWWGKWYREEKSLHNKTKQTNCLQNGKDFIRSLPLRIQTHMCYKTYMTGNQEHIQQGVLGLICITKNSMHNKVMSHI